MNFLRSSGKHAEYIVSGYWSAKAPVEALHEGETRVVWDGSGEGYRRLPAPAELKLAPDAAYLHYVSNETVEGLEFTDIPGLREGLHEGLHEVPLVCDMSSNLLAAPLDISRYAMIYAHAQKNLGPAGVTVVILRDEFAQRATHALPTFLDYRTHIQARSVYNTPPVFAIYVLMLVTRWLRDEIGGVDNMAAINRAKSERLYRALDAEPGFYRVHGERACRSTMNVAFRLPDAATEAQFIDDARRAGLHGLEGHRSIGGLRASLYNAVTPEAVEVLSDWMGEFRRVRG
jgi:phosphoserine aminotransferase